MDVIAEGIETLEQAEKLIEFDCNLGQGYYYARPVNTEKTEELLEQETIYRPINLDQNLELSNLR
jgi:EAL domain-containing protein (putative c-di-GMP-specific phosphodiesterase class I)